MFLVTVTVAWLSTVAFVVAMCRAAAYGDMKLAGDGEQSFIENRRPSLPAYE